MPIIESHDTAFEDEDAKGIYTTYYKQLNYCATGNYECIYKEDWEGGSILKRFKATSSIEVIYDMMVYLLENNYLNKK